MMNYQDAIPDIVFLRHRSSGWYSRSMRYNKTIRSETREACNKNGMDAGGVIFSLVARAVCACIYLMVLLLLEERPRWMHQRYSHSGGYNRRTNHHIDHLQERDKNGQFSKPQSIDHEPKGLDHGSSV